MVPSFRSRRDGTYGDMVGACFVALLRASIHKSSGRKPVRFAIRTNIRGPISSLSWNAKT
jgi:hypothetical protein